MSGGNLMCKRYILLGSLITIGIFLISACGPIVDFSLKFSGGGYIPSAENPDEKAIFGFHYDGTTEPFKIHGTYNDKEAGVHIRFSEVVGVATGTGDQVPCMAAELVYDPVGGTPNGERVGVLACDDVSHDDLTELNPLFTCVADPCDFIGVSIYEEGEDPIYVNYGEVLGGNLKNLDKE
jgi:hypothetical protein